MQGTINRPRLDSVWHWWRSRLAVQIQHVWIHLINGVSNFLGNDVLSCWLRKQLLRQLGMQLGRGTVIRGGSYLYGGRLKTGIDCQVNRSCYFDFTDLITFGNRVVVGHGVTFVTAKHHMGGADCRAGKDITGQPIILESGVWIGANATLLPGVTVHRGAVVAAGAVVTKNIPPNTVAAGVPARVIRQLGAEGIGGASTSDVLKSNVLQEAPL